MSKRPNISKEAQVLLKLLRIALGTEPRKYFGEVVEPFPEGVDWKEVVRLSYEHKVSAIAVDGLEASKYDPYEGLDEKQTEELKAVLVPWVKDVENTEWSYCYYVEVLKTLCQIFRDNGLTPIILKGYGLSLNYPRPSHRGAGDIDLFLVDEDGKPAGMRGNEIARSVLGVEVTQEEHEHHSIFTFKGISVENHYGLLGHHRGRDIEIQLKDKLQELLMKDLRKEDCYYIPSKTFYAIYLIQHFASHFTTFNVKYRQFCDYVTLFQNNETCDWSMVMSVLRMYDLEEFSDGLYGLFIKMLNFDVRKFGCSFTNNQEMEKHLLHSMAIERQKKTLSVSYIRNYLKRAWTFKYFERKTILEMLFLHCVNSMKRRINNGI